MPVYITYLEPKKIKAPKSIRDLKDLIGKPKTPTTIDKYVKTKTIIATPNNTTESIIQTLDFLTRAVTELNVQYPEASKKDHFDVFQIPKASGGFRTIKAPHDELKRAYSQIAYILEHGLHLLSHNSAYAYTAKRCTRDALVQHQINDSQWFLKLDVEKFFDHCDTRTIASQLTRIYPLSLRPELCEALAEFATWNNELPQGTPLSPIITNLLMIPFDYHFGLYAAKSKFVYTRYADDLLISSKESFRFDSVIKAIESIFENQGYPFKIKREKTRYGNRAGSNWNLGLMLNRNNDITVGHAYKKQLKTLVHKTVYGELDPNDPHIMGLIAYLKQIEPNYYKHFENYVRNKYGRTLREIMNP